MPGRASPPTPLRTNSLAASAAARPSSASSSRTGWSVGVEIASGVYKPRDPRTAALYEVVRDNLETLYGAIKDGAIAVRIPKHARKESSYPEPARSPLEHCSAGADIGRSSRGPSCWWALGRCGA